MKLLKITTEKKEGDIFSRIQIGIPKIELIDEAGETTDISNSVRSCVVDIGVHDLITAKLEMYVGELDIDGVRVSYTKSRPPGFEDCETEIFDCTNSSCKHQWLQNIEDTRVICPKCASGHISVEV